ncbi:response regulator [Methanosphaerula palustris]|uniref:Putative PAS/PAC sensor protein n=1 Tax=Methanosphaerula palustris (strain ATCC BAA-1556 / DSM 19958 / E1-9c) TaxID=521011 RepID=B8GFE5_METPE|nr:response regulator [Methanosphaerula palustris]ACL15993.1 putative PAS/PAC sensor protein [Methanosphaerula palustris E1-9c]
MISVLYVDDERSLLDIGKLFLEKRGDMQVETLTSATEALQVIREHPFDAIISDYQMPDMDGLSFLKELRKQDKQVPFVLFTGRGREEVVIEALNCGADFYLQKGGNATPQFAELRNMLQTAITRRKDNEKITRYNRALRMILACNQIIVRTTDEQELLHQICETLVNLGGYRFSWVGSVEGDEKIIHPLAYAGFEDGYLSAGTISWRETADGDGHTRTAIRTRTPAVARNLQTNFNAAWRKEAAARGYASSIAIPMIDDEFVWGVLKVYAIETDAFDPEEVDLLTGLARDMAHGIFSLRTERERRTTRKALEISEARYRAIIEDQTDMVARFTPDGLLTFVNTSFITSCNRFREDLIGADLYHLLAPEERETVRSRIIALTADEPLIALEAHLPTPQGIKAVHWVCRAITDRNRTVVEFQIVGREIDNNLTRSPENPSAN